MGLQNPDSPVQIRVSPPKKMHRYAVHLFWHTAQAAGFLLLSFLHREQDTGKRVTGEKTFPLRNPSFRVE